MSEVPPTRMNQQIFKAKKKAAQGGHKLLKKKADALKVSLFFARVAEMDLIVIHSPRSISCVGQIS